jgi:hypothetical protein
VQEVNPLLPPFILSPFLTIEAHMLMEDSPRPGASSYVGDTSGPVTASFIVVTTMSENAQQQQISGLVEEELQVLESKSYAMKRYGSSLNI